MPLHVVPHVGCGRDDVLWCDMQESSVQGADVCAQCPHDGGLECIGGMEFNVLPGWWLAPDAKGCRSADCVLDRVYECDAPDACIMNSSTSVKSFSQFEDLQLCRYGYDPTVVKCAR